MPTLTLPDGAYVTWGETSTNGSLEALQMGPSAVASSIVKTQQLMQLGAAVVAPDDSTAAPLAWYTGRGPYEGPIAPEALGPTESDENLKVALRAIPPKWTATAWRFAKTLVAGMAAAFGFAWATTGGTIEGLLRDPGAFAVALGTAVILAIQKFATWKD